MNYYAKQTLAKVKGKLRAKKYQMRKKNGPQASAYYGNLIKYLKSPEILT